MVAGRPVGLAWFSPDCKHFSKAKGGKPVEKKIRGLAWVALKWAGLVKPRIIMLENVEEFRDWGPVHDQPMPRRRAPRCKHCKRPIDGKPCPRRKGMTFKRWATQLRNLGYAVDWREMRACDFGAPTIRKRLFLVARWDVATIPWPEETHAREGDLFLQPYRTAADCIDWSLPCPSIFLTRAEGRAIGVNRPLAEATMRRIARGIERYVIKAAKPFIVNMSHGGKVESVDAAVSTIATEKGGLSRCSDSIHSEPDPPGGNRTESIEEPFKTVTGAHRGEKVLVTPFIERQFGRSSGNAANEPLGTTTAGGGGKSALIAPTLIQTGYGERGGGGKHAVVSAFLSSYYGAKTPAGDARGSAVTEPLATQPTENRHAVVSAFITQHNAGPNNDNLAGRAADAPISTITARGTNQSILTSHLVKLAAQTLAVQRTNQFQRFPPEVRTSARFAHSC